jgi:hypothetical protein
MNERGSMLPYLGALIFVGLVLLGLALDTALLAATYREAAVAADAGAEAGAAQLEPIAAYGGAVVLDQRAAIAAAETASLVLPSRAGRSASATTDGTEVCIVVVDHYEPRLLTVVGIGAHGVSVRACAVPRQG